MPRVCAWCKTPKNKDGRCDNCDLPREKVKKVKPAKKKVGAE